LGLTASLPLALRLMPTAIGMQQRPPIRRGSWIAGAACHRRLGDVQHPLKQSSSALWRPWTNPEGHHEPPHGGTGHPYPRIAIGLSVEPSPREMVCLGRDQTPERVQLACEDLEGAPPGEPHPPPGLRSPIQPCTPSIFVDLDDTCRRADGLAFRSCPHRRLKHRRCCVQVHGGGAISDRYPRFARPAESVLLAVTPAILDEVSLQARAPIILATPVRTGERLAVHGALLEKAALLYRECHN
jgi:hypothetical protein